MVDYYKSAGTTVIQGNGVTGSDYSEPHYKLLAGLDSGSKAAIGDYGGHGQTGSTGGSTTLAAVSGVNPEFTTNHTEQDSVFISRSSITSAVSSVAIDLDLDYACHIIKLRNILVTSSTHKITFKAGFQTSSVNASIYTHQTVNRSVNTTSLQGQLHRRSSSSPGCLFPYEFSHSSLSGIISGTELGINVDIIMYSASLGNSSQPTAHRGAITGFASCWGYSNSNSVMFDEESYFLFTNAQPLDRMWVLPTYSPYSLDGGQVEYYVDPGMPAA